MLRDCLDKQKHELEKVLNERQNLVQIIHKQVIRQMDQILTDNEQNNNNMKFQIQRLDHEKN